MMPRKIFIILLIIAFTILGLWLFYTNYRSLLRSLLESDFVTTRIQEIALRSSNSPILKWYVYNRFYIGTDSDSSRPDYSIRYVVKENTVLGVAVRWFWSGFCLNDEKEAKKTALAVIQNDVITGMKGEVITGMNVNEKFFEFVTDHLSKIRIHRCDYITFSPDDGKSFESFDLEQLKLGVRLGTFKKPITKQNAEELFNYIWDDSSLGRDMVLVRAKFEFAREFSETDDEYQLKVIMPFVDYGSYRNDVLGVETRIISLNKNDGSIWFKRIENQKFEGKFRKGDF